MRLRNKLLAAVAIVAAVAAYGEVRAQLNPGTAGGFQCGPVNLGCFFGRFAQGNAGNPAQTSMADPATGEWFGTPGMTNFSANGTEVERMNPSGVFPLHTSTPITTAGAGTLTAAAMVGGLIPRTGPTAGFTDTTDTAANIDALLAAGSGSNTLAVPVGI